MCAGNPGGIRKICAELVFRRTHQECAHNPKQISALRPELVFRQVPGELAQRLGQTQWFWRSCLRRALLEPVGRGVIRVRGAPPGLGPPPPRGLALRLAAGVLTVSHSWIRPEPPAADRARSLPGLGHRDPSSPCLARRRASVQAPWVTSGKQGWVNSRERRSAKPPEP